MINTIQDTMYVNPHSQYNMDLIQPLPFFFMANRAIKQPPAVAMKKKCNKIKLDHIVNILLKSFTVGFICWY